MFSYFATYKSVRNILFKQETRINNILKSCPRETCGYLIQPTMYPASILWQNHMFPQSLGEQVVHHHPNSCPGHPAISGSVLPASNMSPQLNCMAFDSGCWCLFGRIFFEGNYTIYVYKKRSKVYQQDWKGRLIFLDQLRRRLEYPKVCLETLNIKSQWDCFVSGWLAI